MLSKEGNRRFPQPYQQILKPINKKIMKTQNNLFFQQLGGKQLQQLVKEVTETVAGGVPAIQHKTAFGIVDLWNIERTRRPRVIRRHTGLTSSLL